MNDLCEAIRSSRPQIEAWASQDSRFQRLLAGEVAIEDDHFSVSRGSHLEDYIQEWLFNQAEARIGANVTTALTASLNSAVASASRSSTPSSLTTAGLANHSSMSGSVGSLDADGGPGISSSGFVRGADLITGIGWQAATRDSPAGPQEHDETTASCGTSRPADASASDRSSHRRRLNVGGAFACGRLYCPVAGCPNGANADVDLGGWQSLGSGLRDHLEEHVGGRRAGDIPAQWLEDNGFVQCAVCSRLLARRYGSACPRCRPEMRAQSSSSSSSSPPPGRPLPSGSPNLAEVFEDSAGVKHQVSQGARRLGATCVLTATADVVNFNDVRAWTELISLQKLVLRSSKRGGKGHKQRLEAETKRRCRFWLEGQRSSLWQPLGSRRPSRRPVPNDPGTRQARDQRTESLLNEDLLAKACSALVREPPVEVTNPVVREMERKHPAAREGEAERLLALRRVAAAAAIQIDVEAVEKALKSFKRGSGAGPSGLRPEHLKAALVPGLRDEILRHMTLLVNLLARGEAPPEIQQWLCGASLTALPKPSGGLRPIAVGETWRRFVGKALAKSVAEDARAYLEPLQVGVGTSGGCEAVVHVVRQWLHRNRNATDKVLVTVDLENAFNSVDRSAVLRAARRVLPGIVPWSDFCYSSPSLLKLGRLKLSSARGIQQGDPLGPALFAIAIHDALVRCREMVARERPNEIDFVAFYLDDGTVAGSAQAVRAFCDHFAREMADIGLVVNASKSEVVPASGPAFTFSRGLFSNMQWREDRNLKLLGAPLGDANFCAAHSEKRARKAEALLKQIGRFGQTQGALRMLRHCGSWCKLIYSARTVPPELHQEALAGFAANLRKTLEQITADSVPDRCWRLAQLGIGQGGVGIRDPVRHAPAAFIASVAQSKDLCSAIDADFDEADADGGLLLTRSIEVMRGNLLDAASLDRGGTALTQKDLSGMLDAASLQELLRAERHDPFFQAHVSLNRLSGAGAWLTAPMIKDGREMDSSLFRVSLKRRIRAPIFEADAVCPCCGEAMDRWADHALVCACAGDRTVRHNAVRNQVCADAQDASLRPEREKAGLLPERPQSDDLLRQRRGRRPADIWLPRGESGRSEALDFAITSSMRSDIFRQASLDPGLVFERYERYKRGYQDTAAQCEARGFEFVPMVLEAHSGGWSGVARQKLAFIAEQAAQINHENPDATALRMAQRISIALHRENARAVLRRHVATGSAPSLSAWTDYVDES